MCGNPPPPVQGYFSSVTWRGSSISGIDRRIGVASAVMLMLYGTAVVKMELNMKAIPLIYSWSIVIPLIYGHRLWLETQRMRWASKWLGLGLEIRWGAWSCERANTSPKWKGIDWGVSSKAMCFRHVLMGGCSGADLRLLVLSHLVIPQCPLGWTEGVGWRGLSFFLTKLMQFK